MYDDPDNYEFLDEFDYGDQNYCFDLIRLARDTETGKVYIAQDSGCSCPVPFEDHTWPTDWTEVRNLQDVRAFVRGFTSYRYGDEDGSAGKAMPTSFAKGVF